MEKHDFIKVLRSFGRTVSYYPTFAKVFGSSNVGVFLSQMLYWEGKQEDEDGWIRKPLTEIEEELGFTRYEMETIRKVLKAHKVLEEKKMGMPAKLHYNFDWNRVNDLINDYQFNLTRQAEAEQELVEKQPNVAYRMKEYFLEKLKEYMPEMQYSWMEKDWGSIKLLKQLFEKRIIEAKRKSNPELLKPEASEDEVFDSFKKFIDMLPEFYRTKRYTPSLLYSDFNAIAQQVIADSKPKITNVNTNKGADFAKAAAEAASNV